MSKPSRCVADLRVSSACDMSSDSEGSETLSIYHLDDNWSRFADSVAYESTVMPFGRNVGV